MENRGERTPPGGAGGVGIKVHRLGRSRKDSRDRGDGDRRTGIVVDLDALTIPRRLDAGRARERALPHADVVHVEANHRQLVSGARLRVGASPAKEIDRLVGRDRHRLPAVRLLLVGPSQIPLLILDLHVPDDGHLAKHRQERLVAVLGQSREQRRAIAILGVTIDVNFERRRDGAERAGRLDAGAEIHRDITRLALGGHPAPDECDNSGGDGDGS